MAAVILANLFRLFLDKRLEGFEVGGAGFARLRLGRDHGIVKILDVVLFLNDVGKMRLEGAVICARWAALAKRFRGGLMLVNAQPLDAQDGILRAAITFILDLELLLPESIEQRIFLDDGVVLEALGKVHLMPVAIFLDERLHAPLGIGRRLLGASAEEHVVLDLEAPHGLFQLSDFFVNGQSDNSTIKMKNAGKNKANISQGMRRRGSRRCGGRSVHKSLASNLSVFA